MKIALIALTIFYFGLATKGQISSKQLAQNAIDSVFTDSLKQALQIQFPIYRVYTYNDIIGKHYIVMTENPIDCNEGYQCFDSLKAFCFREEDENLALVWSLSDFILQNGNEVSEEYRISFWTKYFELDDYDKDGFVDPIMVYGSYGMNGTSDGRIKILIYHKGKKRAIRHQNGTLDFERNSKVDKQFYNLPIQIQERVKTIMANITENDHGIFPAGWKNKMEQQQLYFDEH